jgi:hypothetical protein
MKRRDYEQAVTAAASFAQSVAEIHVKLVALERVLQTHNPSLCAAYLKEIENLKSQKFYEMNLLAIEGLRERLLQE